MRTAIRFFFLLLIFLPACAANNPQWYDSEQIDNFDSERYLTAVASGPYYESEGVKDVEKKVLADLSRQIKKHVKSRLDFWQYSSTYHGKEKFGVSIFELVKEERKFVLSKATGIKEELSDDRKTIYLASVIDRKRLASIYSAEVHKLLALFKTYSSAKNLREVFFNYRIKEKLTQLVEASKIKGKLYAADHFKDVAVAAPANKLVGYKLSFSETTDKNLHKALEAMLVKSLKDFGIRLDAKSSAELHCSLKLVTVKNQSQDFFADFKLFEVLKGGQKKLVTHCPFTGAQSDLISKWLPVAMKNKLKIEVDQGVNRVLAALKR
jgi:hypothetical protein